MKKKIILTLTACLFAAGTIIHYNLTENTSRMDVSLADISVMAQADGENPPIWASCYFSYLTYENPEWWIVDCISCERINVSEFHEPVDVCLW